MTHTVTIVQEERFKIECIRNCRFISVEKSQLKILRNLYKRRRNGKIA